MLTREPVMQRAFLPKERPARSSVGTRSGPKGRMLAPSARGDAPDLAGQVRQRPEVYFVFFLFLIWIRLLVLQFRRAYRVDPLLRASQA